jgi:hypothetical protein
MATVTLNHVTFEGNTYERLALILFTRLRLEKGCEMIVQNMAGMESIKAT